MSKKPTIPNDFKEVLEEHGRINAGFYFLHPDIQQEYVDWIESSTNADERERRIYEAIEKLRDEIE